jgi:hypothetical protein
MTIAVIFMNLILALYLLFLAWQVWQLKQVYARLARDLVIVERDAQGVFQNTIAMLCQERHRTVDLRQQYQDLQIKVRQAHQALALIALGRTLLLGRIGGKFRPQRLKKSTGTAI